MKGQISHRHVTHAAECLYHFSLDAAMQRSDHCGAVETMALPAVVSQQIQCLLEQASEGTKLVQAVQACMDCLKEHGLVWHQRVLPHHIGVHCLNRDGMGLAARDVLELISDISSVA